MNVHHFERSLNTCKRKSIVKKKNNNSIEEGELTRQATPVDPALSVFIVCIIEFSEYFYKKLREFE